MKENEKQLLKIVQKKLKVIQPYLNPDERSKENIETVKIQLEKLLVIDDPKITKMVTQYYDEHDEHMKKEKKCTDEYQTILKSMLDDTKEIIEDVVAL